LKEKEEKRGDNVSWKNCFLRYAVQAGDLEKSGKDAQVQDLRVATDKVRTTADSVRMREAVERAEEGVTAEFVKLKEVLLDVLKKGTETKAVLDCFVLYTTLGKRGELATAQRNPRTNIASGKVMEFVGDRDAKGRGDQRGEVGNTLSEREKNSWGGEDRLVWMEVVYNRRVQKKWIVHLSAWRGSVPFIGWWGGGGAITWK